MAGNPRIDDLRKRIEKDPGSRLFAQLAEELRKDGELDEAIQVARAGLKQHSNYPSARMTLGRALLDTGDWAAAKTEFESVLAGAPDNILASRYIAECLESLGDREGALARYKATLAMAPGEKHVMARVQELEKAGVKAAALPAASLRPPTTGAFARPGTGMFARPAAIPAAPAAARPPSAAIPAAPPASPMPVAAPPLPPLEQDVPETIASAPPEPKAPAQEFAPIPLVDADEEFELERPFESPPTGIGTSTATPPAPPAPPTPVVVAPPAPPPAPAASAAAPIPLSPVEDAEFELESPYEAPAAAWKPSIPPLPPPEPEPEAEPERAPTPVSVPAPAAAPESPGSLLSPTLGELYFNQGFTDKAVEVYRELSGREPGNERLSARLKELEALQRTLGAPAPAASAAAATPAEPPPLPAPASAPAPAPVPPPEAAPAPARAEISPADERRQAIERTIGRLEGLLAAIRKG